MRPQLTPATVPTGLTPLMRKSSKTVAAAALALSSARSRVDELAGGQLATTDQPIPVVLSESDGQNIDELPLDRTIVNFR